MSCGLPDLRYEILYQVFHRLHDDHGGVCLFRLGLAVWFADIAAGVRMHDTGNCCTIRVMYIQQYFCLVLAPVVCCSVLSWCHIITGGLCNCQCRCDGLMPRTLFINILKSIDANSCTASITPASCIELVERVRLCYLSVRSARETLYSYILVLQQYQVHKFHGFRFEKYLGYELLYVLIHSVYRVDVIRTLTIKGFVGLFFLEFSVISEAQKSEPSQSNTGQKIIHIFIFLVSVPVKN